ncbi:hypothetical protein GCM10027429_07630 [Marivirga atlantica]|jgi:hypothetical protein
MGDSSLILFESFGKKGIKNSRGEILLPAKFEALSWESNPNSIKLPLIPYKKNGHWGMFSKDFEEITPAKYTRLIPFTNELLVAGIRGKYSQTNFYGLIDLNGKMEVEFTFRNLIPAGEFLIAASRSDNKIKYGVLDEKGKAIIPFEYFQINYLGHDVFALTNYEGEKELINIANIKTPILTELDSATAFKDGVSVVFSKGRQGLLNTEGKLLLPIAYKKISYNDGKVLEVTPMDQWIVFDQSGEKILNEKADSIYFLNEDSLSLIFQCHSFVSDINLNKVSKAYSGKIVQSFGNLFIVQSKAGNYLISKESTEQKEQLGRIIEMNENFLITQQKKYGGQFYSIRNKQGKVIKVDGFELFDHSVHAQVEGYWGIYNTELEPLVNPLYDEIYTDKHSNFIVSFRSKYGVIDSLEQWVIPPHYKAIELIEENIYWAVTPYLKELIITPEITKEADLHYLIKGKHVIETNISGEVRLVSHKGEPIMEYTKGDYYDSNRQGVLIKDENSLKYFNGYGDFRFKVSGYDSIGLTTDSFLPVFKDGAYGFIDFNGKLRIANRYTSVKLFSDDYAAVQIGENWGYVNDEEFLKIQPYYDFAASFKSGVAVVSQNGKFGLINKLGEVVIEMRYDSIVEQGDYYLLKEKSKWGLATANGSIIRYPTYTSIEIIENYILLERYNQYELIDKTGTSILPEKYDAIYFDESLGYLLTKQQSRKKLVFITDLISGKYP